MKRIPVFIFLLLAFCLQAAAQNNKGHQPRFSPQEFTQKKEAFIIREAKLLPHEAANFFPLYHKMGKDKFEISGKIWKLMQRARTSGLKEKEYASILAEIDKLQLEKVKLENSYHQKFCKVLSTEKVLRVIAADMKFERHILKEMVHRHPKPMSMNSDSLRIFKGECTGML